MVSVCGPEAFRETESLYNNPEHLLGVLTKQRGEGIHSLNDSEWKERRRIIYKTMRGSRVEKYVDKFVVVARETMDLWRPGKRVSVMREMLRICLKGILTTLFVNVFDDDSSVQWLADIFQSCKHEGHLRLLSNTLPDGAEYQRKHQLVKDCLRKMLRSRTQQRDSNQASEEVPLLDAIITSGLPEESYMTDMITISSGFESSGVLLTWLLHYLALHPEVQDKLLEEIEERVNDETDESLKSYVLTSDSYLRQVLDEALRRSNIAPFAPHYSNTDHVTCGYVVPAKTPVVHSMGVTLMDETIWENPDTFDPDRFAPGSELATRGREFRPFGVSRTRRCPANQFTYVMVSVYLAVLVRHFKFLSVGEQEVEMFYGMITYPKTEILVQVEPRK